MLKQYLYSKKEVLFLMFSIAIAFTNSMFSQAIDHHFFFVNESLVNQDPTDFTPGKNFLLPVDYNENGNSGFPTTFSNYYTTDRMQPFCSSAKKTVYNFRQKTGLAYKNGNGVDYKDYTITIIIKFNAVVGNNYYRIIDFSNGTEDAGIYARGTNLNFYTNQSNTIASNVFSSSQYTFLTLTRDGATNRIEVYVGANRVTSYVDTANLYKVASNGRIVFARDNLPGTPAPNEDTNGSIA